MVGPDLDVVDRRLGAGGYACTGCGARLRPWGWARERQVRHLAGAERGLAALVEGWMRRLPAQVRAFVAVRPPTIDLDSTEVEVYGRHKDGVAYYAGQRAGRPHLASWAQAALPLAADLLAGTEDVRPRAGALLRRATPVPPRSATRTGPCHPPRPRSHPDRSDSAH